MLSKSQAKFLPSTVSLSPARARKTREQLLEYLWQLCSEISPYANTLKSC